MLFDLNRAADMAPVVGLLFSTVKENNERLKSITSGMVQKEIDYRGPNGEHNSTGQLIKHLLFVDLNWVYRIMGEPLPEPLKKQHGPMIDENNRLPMVNGLSLDVLLNDYETVIGMLREACTQLTDEDLIRVVTFGHHNEKSATIRWGLWHIADHSRYHQANINQLRRWYSNQ